MLTHRQPVLFLCALLAPISFLPHDSLAFPWFLYIRIPFQIMLHAYLCLYLRSTKDYHFQHSCA